MEMLWFCAKIKGIEAKSPTSLLKHGESFLSPKGQWETAHVLLQTDIMKVHK